MNAIILTLSIAIIIWTLRTAQKSLQQLQTFTLLQSHTNDELEYLQLNNLPNRVIERANKFESDAVISHDDQVIACIVRDTKTYIVLLPRKEV
jgi:hypothetical protein